MKVCVLGPGFEPLHWDEFGVGYGPMAPVSRGATKIWRGGTTPMVGPPHGLGDPTLEESSCLAPVGPFLHGPLLAMSARVVPPWRRPFLGSKVGFMLGAKSGPQIGPKTVAPPRWERSPKCLAL